MAARLQPPPRDAGMSNGRLQEMTDSKNRKSYTLDFKRQVINFYHAHAGNITLSAKMFGVDRKMVRSWVEQQDFFRHVEPDLEPGSATIPPTLLPASLALRNNQPHQQMTRMQSVITSAGQRKRLERTFSSGSSARYPELEKALSDWWFSQTNRGLDIKAKNLKEQALKFFQELYPYSSDQEFKASTGWLQRFVTRMENGGVVADFSQRLSNLSAAATGQKANDNSIARYPSIAPKPQPLTPSPKFRTLSRPPALEKRQAVDENPPKRTRQSLPEQKANQANNQGENRTFHEGFEDTSDEIVYATMSDAERLALDRQNQETEKFFQDCVDFLEYLDKVSVELANADD